MRLLTLIFLLHFIPAFSQTKGLFQNNNSLFLKLNNTNINDVKWTTGFWADRIKTCEQIMIPYMKTIYMNRALKNFRIAAGMESGEFRGSWWLDGDFYKWMEARIMTFAETHDNRINEELDSIIEILAKAQQPNGYINSTTQIGHGVGTFSFTNEQPFENKKKWQSDRELEVYNMGHLITAAVIHYRITGKDNFLTIAQKAADNMYEIFKVPSAEKAALIFNPPQIMGLVELYRVRGNKKYLELAITFLDMMGKGRRSQTENRLPVREVQHAWGHAVIGTYLYCGMADVYAETGDTALLSALNRLWNDVTYKKMYVTGGVGSYHKYIAGNDTITECFGEAYDLPNSSAYNETCANIGNAMWNWRMLGITGEAKYADVMEKIFYNSLLSSVAVDGKSFFYTNVLRWFGKDHKLESNDSYERWNLPRGGICCPSNTARTIAEMSTYAYSVSNNSVYVNLYGSNTLNTTLPSGNKVNFIQQTEYPWDGTIKLTCLQSQDALYSLQLRIPQWAKGASIIVNGKVTNEPIESGKYFKLERNWKKGDVVELILPMQVQILTANPKVTQDLNHVAISRGPVIYCIESCDIPANTKLQNIFFSGTSEFTPIYKPSLLGGITVLQGKVYLINNLPGNKLYKTVKNDKDLSTINISLIPYYAWNNRGIGEMAVWMPVINSN
jgi:DUF1680 family protein